MDFCNFSVLDYTWHVIINPNALEGKCMKHWAKMAARLEAERVRYEMHPTAARGDASVIAKQLCDAGIRHLLVVGGDGSINEVVDGIMRSNADIHDVCLAVFPLGRGNDWARTHQYPTRLNDCVDVFLKGKFMRHDVGNVQTLYDGIPVADRFFINIAGFGFDAEVIYDTQQSKPHFLGISVYIVSLFRCLFGYKSLPVKITAPGFSFQDKTFLAVAANCQYNGGGMRQAPDAKPDDGLLDVVVIPQLSYLRLFWLMLSVFSGKHIKKSKGLIKTCRAESVDITCDTLCRGEVEGEMLVSGNYHVTIQPSVFWMLTNQSA